MRASNIKQKDNLTSKQYVQTTCKWNESGERMERRISTKRRTFTSMQPPKREQNQLIIARLQHDGKTLACGAKDRRPFLQINRRQRAEQGFRISTMPANVSLLEIHLVFLEASQGSRARGACDLQCQSLSHVAKYALPTNHHTPRCAPMSTSALPN